MEQTIDKFIQCMDYYGLLCMAARFIVITPPSLAEAGKRQHNVSCAHSIVITSSASPNQTKSIASQARFLVARKIPPRHAWTNTDLAAHDTVWIKSLLSRKVQTTSRVTNLCVIGGTSQRTFKALHSYKLWIIQSVLLRLPPRPFPPRDEFPFHRL